MIRFDDLIKFPGCQRGIHFIWLILVDLKPIHCKMFQITISSKSPRTSQISSRNIVKQHESFQNSQETNGTPITSLETLVKATDLRDVSRPARPSQKASKVRRGQCDDEDVSIR